MVVASALAPAGAERADGEDFRGRRSAHQPRMSGDRAGDGGAVLMRLLGLAERVERAGDRAGEFGMARGRCRNRSPRPAPCRRWRACAPRRCEAWRARIAPDRRRPGSPPRSPPRASIFAASGAAALWSCAAAIEIVRLAGAQDRLVAEALQHRAHRAAVGDPGAHDGRVGQREDLRFELRPARAARSSCAMPGCGNCRRTPAAPRP